MSYFSRQHQHYGSPDETNSSFVGNNNHQMQQLKNVAPASHGGMPNDREMKEAENFIAAELNKLSFKERSDAYNDVHCVGEDLQESETMIRGALVSFEEAIQRANNPMYHLALHQNREYVEDPAFRLKFLRSNMYDVDKSVWQLMSFLEQKALYFGEDKLARDIMLEDLTSEELALLKSGFYHIQDGRDRMGRVVVICFKNKLPQRWAQGELLCRVVYYISFNILLSMPEVQLKGIVTIQLSAKNVAEPPASPNFQIVHAVSKCSNALPMRCSALHSCFDTLTGTHAIDNAILFLWQRCVPEYTRSRIRIHCGSHLELIYKLRSFGIAMDTFPTDACGDMREDILNVWFDKHLRTIQQPSANPGKVAAQVEPGRIFESDVLLGRGRAVQSHPGNVRFRKFLEEHQEEYEKSPRFMRHTVAAQFVRILNYNGVRFLHRGENDVWVESEFEDAERKVGQYFRELRKQKK